MKNVILILILAALCGCRFPGIDNIPKPKPHREVVYGQSKAIVQQTVNVRWPVNASGYFTNADGLYWNSDTWTVLEEAHDLSGIWKISCITQGTNYSEPMQDRMFYRNYNTNIVTGERSDFGTTYWTNL